MAEEVAKVDSDLVALDKDGKPYSVRYEAVNAMLLTEFPKEQRKEQSLEATIARRRNSFDWALAQERKEFESALAVQQKEIQALTASLKEETVQLQKVTTQLAISKAGQ